MPISKKRLDEIDAIPDDKIDTSDIAEVDETFFDVAKLVVPAGTAKKPVTIRLDEDVAEWFRAQGKGHLTRMNAVLRAYMIAQQAQEKDISF